ncbi:MAG: tetratricopeptide repeat protein [Myxococcales bacterium]|nr:tetratricopeptide repeat protein [Myxococcales bacterium]
MPADPKPQDQAMEEIRREVIESRNLVIKTDNLLKNLHAELKMVGKRQEDFQRRQWLSSAVAYALFAVLCAAGSMIVASARIKAAGAEKERFEKQIAELTAAVDKLRAESAASGQASRGAAEAYRMMGTFQGEKKLEGVEAMRQVDPSLLTPLEKRALADRAELVRRELGQGALERGKAAFRKQDYPAAVEELGRFMAMNPGQEDSLDASFFLGASLLQVRKPQEAAAHLARFVSGDKKSKTRDYAMLLLAQAYEQTQQFDKALEVAKEALAAYPNSEHLPLLKGRLSAAKRGLGGAEAPPLPPGAAVAKPPEAASPGAEAAKPAVRTPLRPPAEPPRPAAEAQKPPASAVPQ